jgi:hypothetical protein
VRLLFIGLEQVPDITTVDYRRFLPRLADLDWHVHLPQCPLCCCCRCMSRRNVEIAERRECDPFETSAGGAHQFVPSTASLPECRVEAVQFLLLFAVLGGAAS